MPRNNPRLLWLAIPLAFILYFYRLDAAGLIGPDEPRYAAIGREMARSGDWITPRLWGLPWFEKPPLLYWMTGAAFRLGLGTELAPRLPVALLAVGFLAFYWWMVRREFGCLAAGLATLILGTCGEWLGFSQVGATDLPLAATFSAAMLLAVPWIARRETRFLPAASALLGLAVLAKGLTPLVLAAPVVPAAWWFGRRPDDAGRPAPAFRDLARPRVAAPFLVVALPWYLLCYLRNGMAFPAEFFWRQQVQRFTSGELLHGRPWWYYLPVLAGAFLPWTPLLPLAVRRAALGDRRRLFLLAWVLFGLVFFSLAVNKLAGYILPLFPAAALLVALGLEETVSAKPWLAACALLLVAFPMAVPALPAALAWGLSRAPRPAFEWWWLSPAAVAAAVWALENRGRRLAAVAVIATGVAAGILYVKQSAAPRVDGIVSARGLWRTIAGRAGDVCIDNIGRNWIYGLNYYSVTPLAECGAQPRPLWIVQSPGQPPRLVPAPAPTAPTVDLASPSVVLSPFRTRMP
jgi:4-amino-4-deoxy-L-arabinose transferase-like glycosyltransferase